ncbi:MAG: signal peptidase I [Pirellulaceae bacterium]|nr:signal peptidase I [Pirellulaceae bacterium]
MSEQSSTTVPTKAKAGGEEGHGMVVRETIESFAVALILAFLFRAFVAEAFVIPTGSMAPTLMGAHKDVRCTESGLGYQSGASSEFETETGKSTPSIVVGTTCPLSRFEQPLELKKNWNHATFSGDRILVSKFSYLFTDPKRWDVIVFKFPANARQNYIKRCVGLPNETLRIEHGDISIRPKDVSDFTIARKTPSIVEAMLQPIADTKSIAPKAVQAGVPSSWQPCPDLFLGNPGWSDEKAKPSSEIFSNRWEIEHTPEVWSANCKATEDKSDIAWIRYFHRVLTPLQWSSIELTGKLPAPIAPYSSRLISDFTSYNASIHTDRSNVCERDGKLSDDFKNDWLPSDVRDWGGSKFSRTSRGMPNANLENDGKHWTGDLASEFDVELSAGKGTLSLDLVEAGVHYRCSIDLESGEAKLSAIFEGKKLEIIESDEKKLVDEAKGATSVRAGKHLRLKFANVDDTLTLWVNGSTVDFSPSNRISDSIDKTLPHRPQSSSTDPMDAAPAGLGISGVAAKVSRARVWRDIYYIADRYAADRFVERELEDVNLDTYLGQSMTDEALNGYRETNYPGYPDSKITNAVALARDVLFSSPSLWSSSPLFANSNSVEFTLGDDQFFPMGDNSAASSDARAWTNHYIPRRLLIGRAVVVFWPHAWMAPIPMTPNIGRMGLIR